MAMQSLDEQVSFESFAEAGSGGPTIQAEQVITLGPQPVGGPPTNLTSTQTETKQDRQTDKIKGQEKGGI